MAIKQHKKKFKKNMALQFNHDSVTDHSGQFLKLNDFLFNSEGFQVLFLVHNNAQYRDSLIEHLHKDKTILNLFQLSSINEIEVQLEKIRSRNIHLIEIESFNDDQQELIFKLLNYHRETLAEICKTKNLLIWLSKPVLEKLQLQSPDFWSWRSLSLNFSLTSKNRNQQIHFDYTNTIDLSKKNKKIAELQQYLTENSKSSKSVANLYQELGKLYFSIGELDNANQSYQFAINIFEQFDDIFSVALVKRDQVFVKEKCGKIDEALNDLFQLKEQFKSLTNQKEYAITMSQIADLYQVRGENKKAIKIREEECLPLYEKIGDILSKAVTMGQIADIYQIQGKSEQALKIRKEECLPVYEKVGNIREKAMSMGKIAEIYQERGESEQALKILKEECLPVYEKIGDIVEKAINMGRIADIYQARGESEQALKILKEECLPVYEKIGDIRLKAMNMGKIADIYQARGESKKALQIRYKEELPAYEKIGDISSKAITMVQIADVYCEQGQSKKALVEYENLIPIFQDLQDVNSLAHMLFRCATTRIELFKTQNKFEASWQKICEELVSSFQLFSKIPDSKMMLKILSSIIPILKSNNQESEIKSMIQDAKDIFKKYNFTEAMKKLDQLNK